MPELLGDDQIESAVVNYLKALAGNETVKLGVMESERTCSIMECL